MKLPNIGWSSSMSANQRKQYTHIIESVFGKLDNGIQKRLRDECEIIVIGYREAIAWCPKKKWVVLLNAPVMKEIAIRKGRHRKKVLHNVAHEFGHVIGGSSDKEANRLAKEWGFVP